MTPHESLFISKEVERIRSLVTDFWLHNKGNLQNINEKLRTLREEIRNGCGR